MDSVFIESIIIFVPFLKYRNNQIISSKLFDGLFLTLERNDSDFFSVFVFVNVLIFLFETNEDTLIRCTLDNFSLALNQSSFLAQVFEPEK